MTAWSERLVLDGEVSRFEGGGPDAAGLLQLLGLAMVALVLVAANER